MALDAITPYTVLGYGISADATMNIVDATFMGRDPYMWKLLVTAGDVVPVGHVRAKNNTTGGTVVRTLSRVYIRGKWRANTSPVDEELVTFRGNDSTAIGTLRFRNADKKLRYHDYAALASGTAKATCNNALTPETTYFISVDLNTVAQTAELLVHTTSGRLVATTGVISSVGFNGKTFGNMIQGWQHGGWIGDAGASFDWDYGLWLWSDTAFPAFDTFLVDRPASVEGTHTQWSTGVGANKVAAVAGRPLDNLAGYITNNTANAAQTYTLASCASVGILSTDTILASFTYIDPWDASAATTAFRVIENSVTTTSSFISRGGTPGLHLGCPNYNVSFPSGALINDRTTQDAIEVGIVRNNATTVVNNGSIGMIVAAIPDSGEFSDDYPSCPTPPSDGVPAGQQTLSAGATTVANAAITSADEGISGGNSTAVTTLTVNDTTVSSVNYGIYLGLAQNLTCSNITIDAAEGGDNYGMRLACTGGINISCSRIRNTDALATGSKAVFRAYGFSSGLIRYTEFESIGNLGQDSIILGGGASEIEPADPANQVTSSGLTFYNVDFYMNGSHLLIGAKTSNIRFLNCRFHDLGHITCYGSDQTDVASPACHDLLFSDCTVDGDALTFADHFRNGTNVAAHAGQQNIVITGINLTHIPIDFDCELQQATPTADTSATTPIKWGTQGASQICRVVLGTDITALPAGTVLTAKLHLFNQATEVFGSGFTTFQRFTITGITELANYNTKDGSTAWTTGGSTSVTATNQVVYNYNPAIETEVIIEGFEGMWNDAVADGQTELVVMIRSTNEGSFSTRDMHSSEATDVEKRPYWELTMSLPPDPPPVYNSPSNGATNQNSCGVTLDWDAAGNASGYNVYFSTANPPVTLVSANQPGLTYATGQLLPSTTYYWQIGAVNSNGETLGEIWSFTTQTALGAATTPSPADAATGVAINASFSFTAGAHATGHTLTYYPTADPSSAITIDPATAAGTAHSAPFINNTQYSWYVTSTEGCTSVNSATWTFTTVATIALGPPTNPTPADACEITTIPISTPALSWTNGAGVPTGTTVYFQEGPPEEGLPIPIYNDVPVETVPMPTLEYDTVYYWWVVSGNLTESAQSEYWCFRTELDPNPPVEGDANAGTRNRIRPFRRALDGFGQSEPT